jgi:hypothetical protein
LLREVLMALVPSILIGPPLVDEAVDVSRGLKELLQSLLSETWSSSLEIEQEEGNGPMMLGTRWHFLLAYLDLDDQRSIMELASKALVNLAPSLGSVSLSLSPLPGAAPRKPVRVGFISAHWRFHSVGRLLSGVAIALASDPQARFNVIVLHTSSTLLADAADPVAINMANAESEAKRKNINHRQRFKQVFLEPSSSSFSRVRAMLAAQKLDVLIFGDVGMDPLGSYLALGRFAFSQIAFWGHPVTSGSSSIDYFVSSPLFEAIQTVSGTRRAAHSEQLVLLDGISVAFDEPKAADQSVVAQVRADIIAAAFHNKLSGVLDESGLQLYICAQNPTKLQPAFDIVLFGILERDPRGVVVLLRNAAQPLAHRRLVTRLNRAASANNSTHPRSLTDRIVFVDQTPVYDEYLAIQCAADVFLDPFPFGGGVTALEALACRASGSGLRRTFVPIVTAPNLQTVPGLAAGFLRTAHGNAPHDALTSSVVRLMHGSIVDNARNYVAEAVYLASFKIYREDTNLTRAAILREGVASLWKAAAAVESWGQLIQTVVNGRTRRREAIDVEKRAAGHK